jgi:ATP-dependent protease ClpP protease subunit
MAKAETNVTMILTFAKIVGEAKRTAEMMLYGELGDSINGHDFARELNWLGQNYDEIKIRINSNGGSISQGLSVVAEMLASPANIIAQVDGIAASMAAVILAAADKVIINDYAKVMVHSPYYIDENGDQVKKLSTKDQKALCMLKDTLCSLLEKRGIASDEISKMMKTDSWFTADEALTAKLVDEVAVTGRKKEMAPLDVLNLVAKINELNINPKNQSMKQVIARLKLDEKSDEQAVVAAVDQMETGYKGQVSKLVDKLIVVGKATGSITDKNEASMKKLAATDIDLFVDMLNIEIKPAGEGEGKDTGLRLSDVIAQLNAAGIGSAQADTKDFDWMQKNDPQGLAAMETREPEKFKKLQAAYNAKFV